MRNERTRQLVMLVLACFSLVAGPRAQSPAPESVADRFVRAWNAHDGAAFGELFSEDAYWITASGERVKGRAHVRAYLEKEHATWARSTTMKADDVEVKPLARGLAIVSFRWEIAGADPARSRRGTGLMVAAASETRWMVVAGQVAILPATK